MVKRANCMFCHRKVPVQQMSMPTICDECRELAEYVISQIGTGKEAMNLIYNALSNYYDMLKFQKYLITQQQTPTQTPTPQTPNPSQQTSRKEELKQLLKEILLEMKQKGEI